MTAHNMLHIVTIISTCKPSLPLVLIVMDRHGLAANRAKIKL